eukprot:UN25163
MAMHRIEEGKKIFVDISGRKTQFKIFFALKKKSLLREVMSVFTTEVVRY